MSSNEPTQRSEIDDRGREYADIVVSLDCDMHKLFQFAVGSIGVSNLSPSDIISVQITRNLKTIKDDLKTLIEMSFEEDNTKEGQ